LDLSEYDDIISIPKLKSSMERLIHKEELTQEDMFVDAHCKATGEGLLYGAVSANNKAFNAKMNAILRYGSIYVNEAGGWFMLQDHMKILKTVETENFKFPDILYTESDIKISKFQGGRHFYAKVGGFEVVDESGDSKWNTEKYAYSVAKKFLEN
jgi:hypothetical protein